MPIWCSKRKRINITLEESTIELLDKIVAQTEMDRSHFIELILLQEFNKIASAIKEEIQKEKN